MYIEEMERKSTREAMEEAKNRPLDFDPKERGKYVRSMIALVERFQSQGLLFDEIQAKPELKDFIRDYKNLFETITAPQGYDKQNLKVMLALLDRMGTGELSQHEASVIVGKRMADKYITPELK
jgi:hypothetical protein